MNKDFLDKFGQPTKPKRLRLPISREVLDKINFLDHVDKGTDATIPVRIEHADLEIVGVVTHLNITKDRLMIVIWPSKESTAFQEYAFICIVFEKNHMHSCGVLKP